MRLFRRRPSMCEAFRCDRLASLRLSCLDDVALSCSLHVVTFEKRWGQVFIRPVSS